MTATPDPPTDAAARWRQTPTAVVGADVPALAAVLEAELAAALAELDGIADPMARAAALVQAMDTREALRQLRSDTARELVRPRSEGGQGATPAAVARRLGRPRQQMGQLLSRKQPPTPPTADVARIVARLRQVADLWARLELAAVALTLVERQRPAQTVRLREAVRLGVLPVDQGGLGLTQQQVADRVGRHVSWVGWLLGTKASAGRVPAVSGERPEGGRGRQYPPSFRAQAVRRLQSSGRPLQTVAGELGISPTTLRKFVAEAQAASQDARPQP
jgi:plasmid maintenance system antidote protein VapI